MGSEETTSIDKIEPCAFCGLPSHGRCMWTVEDYIPVKASDLKEGDEVCRLDEASPRGRGAYISDLRVAPGGRKMYVRIQILHKNGRSRSKRVMAPINNTFRAKRKHLCGAPVCLAHLQARAPGVYVCSAHWFAWETAA